MPSTEMNFSVMAAVSRTLRSSKSASTRVFDALWWCAADAGPMLQWVPVQRCSTSRRNAPGTRDVSCRPSSLRKRDHAREARENLVEQHADDANRENGDDHIGDREIIPLVPDEVADAGAADQHLDRDDHEPGDADGDSHARKNGRRR